MKIQNKEEWKRHISEARRENPPIGKKNPMFGRKHSEETKRKIAERARGRKLPAFTEEHKKKIAEKSKLFRHSEETKKKLSMMRKGRKLSEETRKKMSESGKKRPPATIEHRRHLSEALKGKQKSEEHRKNLSGSRHGSWKGGITPKNHKIRCSYEMKKWRKAVLERDGGQCKECGTTKDLHVDHIKEFAYYPELRFDINNGRTLCGSCHRKTESYGRKLNI